MSSETVNVPTSVCPCDACSSDDAALREISALLNSDSAAALNNALATGGAAAGSDSEGIRVSVRFRPFTRQENEAQAKSAAVTSGSGAGLSSGDNKSSDSLYAWELDKTNQLVRQRIPFSTASSNNLSLLQFHVPAIFSWNDSTQQLFKQECRPVVLGALCGVNGTIVAYGQTSAGKTFSMKGTSASPGLIALSLLDLFSAMKKLKSHREFYMRMSYVEVYNEKIKDLLKESVETAATAPTDKQKPKKMRSGGSVAGGGVSEHVVLSFRSVLALLDAGEQLRHYGKTNMNDFSSRSHTIFKLIIESRRLPSNSGGSGGGVGGKVRFSELNFVDLAGSERISQTGEHAASVRAFEGKNINKSLLSFGKVVQILSNAPAPGGNGGSAGAGNGAAAGTVSLPPYRDSKLTFLLKNSLGGNSRTAIVCHCSPHAGNLATTVETLRFSQRALKICNTLKINEVAAAESWIGSTEQRAAEISAEQQTLHARIEEKKISDATEMERKRLEEQEARLKEKYDALAKLILLGKRIAFENEEEDGAELEDDGNDAGKDGNAEPRHRRRATFTVTPMMAAGKSAGRRKKGTAAAGGGGDIAATVVAPDAFRADQLRALQTRASRLESLLRELNAENNEISAQNGALLEKLESEHAAREKLETLWNGVLFGAAPATEAERKFTAETLPEKWRFLAELSEEKLETAERNLRELIAATQRVRIFREIGAALPVRINITVAPEIRPTQPEENLEMKGNSAVEAAAAEAAAAERAALKRRVEELESQCVAHEQTISETQRALAGSVSERRSLASELAFAQETLRENEKKLRALQLQNLQLSRAAIPSALQAPAAFQQTQPPQTESANSSPLKMIENRAPPPTASAPLRFGTAPLPAASFSTPTKAPAAAGAVAPHNLTLSDIFAAAKSAKK